MRLVMELHSAVTLDAVTAAVERRGASLDNPGFCTLCGIEVEGVEPDARAYPCESCGCEGGGQHGVYGAEELLLMMVP